MLQSNEDIIKEFIKFKVEFYVISNNTYESYMHSLKMFAEYLENNFGTTIMHAQADMIRQYRDSMDKARNATIRLRLAPVKGIYHWLSHPTVALLDINPYPPMRLPSPATHPNIIPTAAQIFKIRNSVSRQVRAAAMLELMLSGGMRISEVTQFRCCDVHWTHNVQDYELKKISPFIGGYIDFDPARGFRIKQQHKRIVYFSKLCAKLMRLYMKKFNLAEDSLAPMFPLERGKVYRIILKLGKPAGIQKHKHQDKKYQRESGFLDIDIDKIDGNQEYKDLLRKAQQKEVKNKQSNPFYEKLARIEPTRATRFHPHCLRHFFAMLMYYRNWFGNRQDLITLKDLLGHMDIGTTQIYATSQQIITGDSEWKRIMLGNGFDYQSLFYM